MTTNVKINERTHSIEICTKKYSEASKRFGTIEYRELQEIRKDYPGFKVVEKIKKVNRKDSYKGLNYNFMETYIAKYDSEEKTIYVEYQELRNQKRSFAEMKKWFLNMFPHITKSIDEIINEQNANKVKEC